MELKNKLSIKIYKNYFIVFLNNKIIFRYFILNGNRTHTLIYIFTLLIKMGLTK
jgi:hypothetical protein